MLLETCCSATELPRYQRTFSKPSQSGLCFVCKCKKVCSFPIGFKHILLMRYYTAVSLQNVVLYDCLKAVHSRGMIEYGLRKISAILLCFFKLYSSLWFDSEELKAQLPTRQITGQCGIWVPFQPVSLYREAVFVGPHLSRLDTCVWWLLSQGSLAINRELWCHWKCVKGSGLLELRRRRRMEHVTA